MISPTLQIITASLLDQLWGDPRWLPHPVCFIGSMASALEKFFRKTRLPLRLAGLITLIILLSVSTGIVLLLIYAAGCIHPGLAGAVSIYILYTTIAARGLCQHSKKVFEALNTGDLNEARRRVAMIVGRETDQLNEEEVARAAVESVAESLVDGICAPLFYAFVGGPGAAMCYKAINTADSMFGYKNEKYREFGWASARLDDVANFIPARLTALLIPLAAFLLRLDAKTSWRILRRDRKNHASPNSGHSEAAVAGALGIQLGGSNVYFGKVMKKPTIGEASSVLQAQHIIQANKLTLLTMILLLAVLTLVSPVIEMYLQRL